MSTNYPFYGNKTRRILASKIIIYNKSGSNEEEVVMPRQINEVLQYFLINGKDYMCSAFTNRTNATEQCSSLGNTYPAFLDFNNQTFITNANGMLLGFTSQLKFTDQVTVNAVYQGYNATYVHANLTDPANSGIHGNVSVYMSRDNGVPLSSVILLHDPAYNSTNNNLMISTALVHMSSVSPNSMIPKYLAGFIGNGTTS